MFHEFFARIAFSATVRLRLWKKLASHIKHGMDLETILRKQRDRADKRRSPLRIVYAQALDSLASGHSLGDAFGGFAPAEEVLLITSGQRAGSSELVQSLHLAAELILAKIKIQKAVRGALTYPAFLFCMVLVLLYVVSWFVVPRLALISNPESWFGAARMLYLIASIVGSHFGLLLLPLLVFGIGGVLFSFPHWTGRLRLLADKYPPWSVYRLTVGTVWMFTVATLMRSGMQLGHIINGMLFGDTLSLWLRERITAIQAQYDMGKNLGEAMVDAGTNFPDPILIDDLRDYAAMPGFHLHIHELAQEWLTDSVERIEEQAKILKNVCLMVIMGIVCAILLAIGSLQQQLTATSGGML